MPIVKDVYSQQYYQQSIVYNKTCELMLALIALTVNKLTII